MKSKALPHIILAVVLALVAGVMTIRWLGSMRTTAERRPKVEVKKIEVVVAARAIAKGTRLDGDMVRVKAFEANLAPASAEHVLADVTGRIAARDISQDDPITGDKLLPRGVTASGLPSLVEPGKRAVTVKGTKAMGAGGLITPGSRVDVVATFQVPGKGEAKMSKVLLQDIPVLATGTQMETRVGKDGKEELASTDLFTLMVTPAQAEGLALAADHGSLHFALRRDGDGASIPTAGTDFQRLAGPGPAGEAAPAASAVPSGPPVPQPYGYQAVRASAPLAAKRGGASGVAAGDAGEAGGGQAGSPAAPGAATSPAAPAAAGAAQAGPGARKLSQGSGQITIYDVSIECPTCPPR